MNVKSQFVQTLREEAKRKEGTARKILGLPPLDSASSEIPDDSGQALDLTPNRRGNSYRNDFGGQPMASKRINPLNQQRRSITSGPFSLRLPKLIGTTSPATHGLRTSTKNNPSLVQH
jgi:hypothetical protein